MPTYDEEVDAAQRDAGIAGSWAGGADGMQVTDALLRQVDVGHLSPWCFLETAHPRTPHTCIAHFIGSALISRTILLGFSESKQYPQDSGFHVKGLLTAERGNSLFVHPVIVFGP